MAATYAEFIVRFKEFDQVEQATIDAKLGDAEAFLDVGAFGTEDLYDRAVYYRAAHLLCISPYGQQLQLVSEDGRTTYGDEYDLRIKPLIRRRGHITGGGLP